MSRFQISLIRDAKFEIDLNPEILVKMENFLRKMLYTKFHVISLQTTLIASQLDVAEHDENNFEYSKQLFRAVARVKVEEFL